MENIEDEGGTPLVAALSKFAVSLCIVITAGPIF